METINEGAHPATAGAWLRRARQQRGLHIAALAVMLKVPQAKLEAVEADRWDDLPDATFARALATAMCRALKVDAAPLLGMLPVGQHALDVSPGLNQPFRDRGGLDEGGRVLARPVIWGPAVLLLAAAAIYWFPAGWMPAGSAATPPALTTTSEPAQVVATPASDLTATPGSAPVAASATAGLAADPMPMPGSSAASAPALVPPSAAASAAGAATLRVSTQAESWVEVVDARGQVLLQRLLRPGDTQDVAGVPPLKVRVGNVSGTRIEWRGAAVDLSDRARDRVARLELN